MSSAYANGSAIVEIWGRVGEKKVDVSAAPEPKYILLFKLL